MSKPLNILFHIMHHVCYAVHDCIITEKNSHNDEQLVCCPIVSKQVLILLESLVLVSAIVLLI